MRQKSEQKFYGFDFGRIWFQTFQLPHIPKGWKFTFHCILFGFSIAILYPAFNMDAVQNSLWFGFWPNWPLSEGDFYYRYQWERSGHTISLQELREVSNAVAPNNTHTV